MDTLNKEEIRELLTHEDDVCVSIFMKTNQNAPEGWEKSRIRLKNLLSDVATELKGQMRSPKVDAFLQPARQLVDAGRFTSKRGSGLAIFLAGDFFRTYNVDVAFDDTFEIADRFYIKPLLPAMGSNGRFYLLALSQNQVQLFEGARHTIQPLALEDMPTSMAEALTYDDPERELQFHTSTAATGDGGRAAIHHGHAVEDEEKVFIRQYFQQVSRGIHDFLQDENVPLVLAGVEYLLPIYHAVNDYSHLMDEGVTGNPDNRSAQELHRAAWDIVRPFYEAEREEARRSYQQLAGTERTSSDLADIVRAAHHGRIDTLFMQVDKSRWGQFNPQKNEVLVHAEPNQGDQELLDLAAAQTILHDGRVFPIETDDFDENAPVTAVFRY